MSLFQIPVAAEVTRRVSLDNAHVAPTSQSAVSWISKSASLATLNGRWFFGAPPIKKSAIRQVRKPALRSIIVAVDLTRQVHLDPAPVAPTSQSAVSWISKSASLAVLNGRWFFGAPPIGKSAIRQVWKPALRLITVAAEVTRRVRLDTAPVAPTSQSAVSWISKSASLTMLNGRWCFGAPPIEKSAIQQVWKPALRFITVAAEVTRLISISAFRFPLLKLEPPHVGCYNSERSSYEK